MDKHISVPIPTDQFIELVDFLRKRNDPRPPAHVISNAIDLWMLHADDNPDQLVQTDTQGYQWKNMFLPAGTQIRMQYKGQYFYAKVEGDSMIYDGKSISPSTLANTIAGGSRNAWRDLWIKRPAPYDDKKWHLADDLRGTEEKVQQSYKKVLAAVDDKGEEMAIKVLDSNFRKAFAEAGMEMEEGAGKRYLEWIKANLGRAK